jgi:adenosylmethionine---8-amino-7-oxononanoate aminotransferase
MTLTTEKIFSCYDGSVTDGHVLAYGHSYTGNAIGCIAAKASLEIFEREQVLVSLQPKIEQMRVELGRLKELSAVKEVRQCGFIAGVELNQLAENRNAATDVCFAARDHGLLTRPIRNVIGLMPPLSTTAEQLNKAIEAIRLSILEVTGK